MGVFIGRKKELEILTKLSSKQSASLIIVKGRRRIGKSRLLEEFGKSFEKCYSFSGLPPVNGITDLDQKNEFKNQLARQTNIDELQSNDWGDLFWKLAEITKQGKILIILDEISWMGFKDHSFLGKLKNTWDLYFKRNDKLVLAICGSSSAWIDRNILSNTGFLGRESINMTLEELPLYDAAKFWGAEEKKVSAYEKLKLLAVTGGIPRYLEHIDPKSSAEYNIQNLCFSSSGILFEEFEKIFSDLFCQRNILYKNIVNYLVDGISDRNTLCEKLKIDTGGDITEYLDDLIKSGFISRDFTWNIKNAEISRLSHYRLKDNYSRFYLKYILPNQVKIKLGNMEEFYLSNLKHWYSLMGLQVENLVLSNRKLIKEALNISLDEIVCDNPFFQNKTKTKDGCQIDYMIQTKYNVVYLCEIKFSKNPISVDIIHEMEEKIKRLSLPRHFSYRTVLIHVNGITESLEESKYFSNIINITDFFRN